MSKKREIQEDIKLETSQTSGNTRFHVISTTDSALAYARDHGFDVFPCVKQQKRPAISGGFHSATKDPEKITQIFKDTHNLGIRTGSQSGVFVLDVDVPTGEETLKELIAKNDDLPKTVMSTTPRGGIHYYFAYPKNQEIGCSTSGIGSNLDIRGEGGYAVAAPSSTSDGNYAWVEGHAPDETEIVEAPDWLLKLIEECEFAKIGNSSVCEEITEIPDGERHTTLVSKAGSMRRAGFSSDVILAALSVLNDNCCNPPLDEDEVEQIAKSMERYEPASDHSKNLANPYKPFPFKLLPDPLSEYVEKGADAIKCDPAYIAAPLLTSMAAAIGNAYEIELKSSWTEPSILWFAVIGESGTMKTPAFSLALEPACKRQKDAMQASKIDIAKHAKEMLIYEKKLAAWKKPGSTCDLPKKPDLPNVPRTIAEDLTIEALAELLHKNPKGLLVACDELASWFGSFDRYSNSAGGDSSRWLSMYNAGSFTIDRKTGEPKNLCIDKASVCIAGGIQPSTLSRCLGSKHHENGLAARFLFVQPPRKSKAWSEDSIDQDCKERVHKVYGLLSQLGLDDDGNFESNSLVLDSEAKTAWKDFYNRHAKEQSAYTGNRAAALSKLEAIPARLALNFHLINWAADGGRGDPGPIGLDCMNRAIELTEWFKNETLRIYANLDDIVISKHQEKVVGLIRENGGSISPSALMNKDRKTWPTAESAEKELNRLQVQGLGGWETENPGPQGGRPSRKLTLHE